MVANVKKYLTIGEARLRMALYDFKTNERGDTNFVSTLILLGIALALAVVFLTFKDQIVTFVQDQMKVFEGAEKGAPAPTP